MQINQFHSGTAVGDAITNQMLLIRDILRENGYQSEIYAEHIAEGLKKTIKSIYSYKGEEDGILIIHHSMGIDCFEYIKKLKDKKILIYHNITPEKFFEDEGIKKYIRIGLQQVKDYRKYLSYTIADSNYNRQELIRMGYDNNIDVLPVQISLNRFEKVDESIDIMRKYQNYKNIIFVGRVVWNKRQDDVIRAFAVYNRYYNKESRLFIIGDDGMQGYINELKNLAEHLKIKEKVVFTGKVSEEDLKSYYNLADLFLCMSEHEGFGVPLLEAMKMGVPVLAYRSSAIPETMDSAGIIITEKNYAYIGSLIDQVLTDQEIYKAVVYKQYERIGRLANTDTEKVLLHAIQNVMNKDRKYTIQMQGPFETSYSLAIVNRKLIEAMDKTGKADVSIYCTEGPGDYEPDLKNLKDKPHAEFLWKKSKEVSYPDVTIRNMYPPRVHDVRGGLNFFAFGWEESVIPSTYIKNFNQCLSGIGSMSNYVTEKLIESGLTIPVRTMGIGVDLVDNYEILEPYDLKTNKKIKFLHISSAFPRKGVDVLLRGYYETFSGNDDVCLVLKTFPNPHNNVEQIITNLNEEYPNPPEVEWINEDLTTEEVNQLYKVADCYVQTSRGEGFGLPVAEAMLAKVPVIVCANSGMSDFCNKDTALLVNYTLEPAKTHVTVNALDRISMWAEPQVDSLKEQFQYFINNKDDEAINKIKDNAYELISTKYTWKNVAERWLDFISEVGQRQYKPKVAMVTTWNSKCGIAEYTRMEIEASESQIEYEIYPNYGVELIKKDEGNVHKRLWHSAFEGNMDVLVQDLLQSDNEIIHFQFNFGFYDLKQLAESLDKLTMNKKVIITFHKTDISDVGGKLVSLRSISESLNKCTALVVHQMKDIELLLSYGIKKELIHLIKHGQIEYPKVSTEYAKKKKNIQSSLVLGSYGFLLPHKGIKEAIKAVYKLKEKYEDIVYMPVCALHGSQMSKDYLRECLLEVERLGLEKNVHFITDYLPNEESMAYLQACDILLMPYKPSQESASGAIRFCLAARRPIITTQQPIFKEFQDCTYQITKCDSNDIANAIECLWNSDKKIEYMKEIEQYIEETSWYRTAEKFYELYMKII